ncbi:MAG: hypothetical protein BGO82_11135 [Devosia sp. 67-54]|uniref:hypothetical protein n=1 Tax=unclassified Devosia TaxID=196773 RepID=UPI00095CB3FC|nr:MULTISPECIES: hypothetical protein [unclassified Devosia]MBN9304806.1 hypothetical protein [Devosia sp.]OJX15233.1 MAG: hypothetical protein BGO82_11135 [Devosia sp. 67-54]
MHPTAKRVTRDELYALVWQKPMSRLAEEFGISGNGLAKICDRMAVPYPPRGYWAKKEAGKPVVTFKLPPRKDGIPEATDIYPTTPKPVPLPEAKQSAVAAAAIVEGVTVPEGIDHLHPRVKAWLVEHRKVQRERELEHRRNRREIFWGSPLLPDLTDRDLYRFRVTSAIFTAIEKAGGRIEHPPITGKVTFMVTGQKVDCSIVEKMTKSLKPREQTRTWTAYPDHHQSGLESSGYIRVAVTTWMRGKQPQWIETDHRKIQDMLPEIVGGLMAVGPIFAEEERQHAERERQRREEEVRRYEVQQRRELDQKRWSQFRAYAANWEERRTLLAFLTEVETRLASEGPATIADSPLSDWLAWAREHADALDPFARGATGMFDAISKVSRY